MTNEEAIKVICKMLAYTDLSVRANLNADMVDACHMAIKALEQESKYCDRNICLRNEYNNIGCDECEVTKSQEQSGDTISRQALLKLMGEEPFNWTDSEQELQAVEDYRNFRNMVEQLPPVNPQESKTVLYSGDGYADGYMVYDMAECPNCGYEYEDGDKDWGLSFCPNCGQKLNWESEDNE